MKARTIISVALIAVICAASAAAGDAEFNYNGRVQVQGQPFDGIGSFKFAIVNEAGGVSYWSNDGTSVAGSEPTSESVNIEVKNGFFSVDIGDVNTTGMASLNASIFNSGDSVFLRVWFSDGVHGFEWLAPDRRIVNPALLGLQSGTGDFTIYVDGVNGDDGHSGLTTATAKRTIQAAVDTVPALVKCNVTIDIADGVYREQVNLMGISVAPGKKLRLLGDNNWTRSSLDDPTVRITGSDNDTTPVRQCAVRAEQCSGLALEGLWLDFATSACLRMTSSSSFEVRQCKVTRGSDPAGPDNIQAHGAYLSTCSDGTVTDCLFEDNYIGLMTNNSFMYLNDLTTSYNNHEGTYVYAGRAIVWNLIANHNGRNGVTFQQNSTGQLCGNCEFSYNSWSGVTAAYQASLLFGWAFPYSGQVKNNALYGLDIAYMAYTIQYTLNTFQGNGAGATRARYGSTLW